MNCRHFFQLLCGVPAMKAELLPAAGTGTQISCGARHEFAEAYPAHTCGFNCTGFAVCAIAPDGIAKS
jgi:hypothetical protein